MAIEAVQLITPQDGGVLQGMRGPRGMRRSIEHHLRSSERGGHVARTVVHGKEDVGAGEEGLGFVEAAVFGCGKADPEGELLRKVFQCRPFRE